MDAERLDEHHRPRAVQGIAAAGQLLVPVAVGKRDRLCEATHPPVRRFDRLDSRTGLVDDPGRFLTFQLRHPRPLFGLVMGHPDGIKAAQRIMQPVRITLPTQVELCPPCSVTLGACIAKAGQERQREPAFEAGELSVDGAQDIAGRLDPLPGRPCGTMSLRRYSMRGLGGPLRSHGMVRLFRQLPCQILPPVEVCFQTLDLGNRSSELVARPLPGLTRQVPELMKEVGWAIDQGIRVTRVRHLLAQHPAERVSLVPGAKWRRDQSPHCALGRVEIRVGIGVVVQAWQGGERARHRRARDGAPGQERLRCRQETRDRRPVLRRDLSQVRQLARDVLDHAVVAACNYDRRGVEAQWEVTVRANRIAECRLSVGKARQLAGTLHDVGRHHILQQCGLAGARRAIDRKDPTLGQAAHCLVDRDLLHQRERERTWPTPGRQPFGPQRMGKRPWVKTVGSARRVGLPQQVRHQATQSSGAHRGFTFDELFHEEAVHRL